MVTFKQTVTNALPLTSARTSEIVTIDPPMKWLISRRRVRHWNFLNYASTLRGEGVSLACFSSNFGRLALGCIDSYDSNQILILQGLSRSTRFDKICKHLHRSRFKHMQIFFSKFSISCRILCEFRKICWNGVNVIHFSSRFSLNFVGIAGNSR